jgi:hypothetical protein
MRKVTRAVAADERRMWSRPLIAEVDAVLDLGVAARNVKLGSSRRVMRLMISKCSSRIAMRSGDREGLAEGRGLADLEACPEPENSRPPLTASIVPAALAVMAGLRKVELTTVKPVSTRGTTAAIDAARVTQSNRRAVVPLGEDVLADPDRDRSPVVRLDGDLEDAVPSRDGSQPSTRRSSPAGWQADPHGLTWDAGTRPATAIR